MTPEERTLRICGQQMVTLNGESAPSLQLEPAHGRLFMGASRLLISVYSHVLWVASTATSIVLCAWHEGIWLGAPWGIVNLPD